MLSNQSSSHTRIQRSKQHKQTKQIHIRQLKTYNLAFLFFAVAIQLYNFSGAGLIGCICGLHAFQIPTRLGRYVIITLLLLGGGFVRKLPYQSWYLLHRGQSASKHASRQQNNIHFRRESQNPTSYWGYFVLKVAIHRAPGDLSVAGLKTKYLNRMLGFSIRGVVD
jgi:hypothetical protein